MPKVAGLAAGSLGAGAVLGALDKGTLGNPVKGAILLGLGLFLPGLMGAKSPMMQGVGDAFIVKGADVLIKESPLASYVRGIDDEYGVSGYETLDDVPVAGITATPANAAMAGADNMA